MVTVVIVESPLEEESSTEWCLTTLGATELDSVWLEDQLDEFVRGFPEKEQYGKVYPPPYVVNIKRDHVSWGASGASIEALLFIGGAVSSGILGNAAYDLLRTLATRIRARITHGRADIEISEEAALEAVQQFIFKRYKMRSDALVVKKSVLKVEANEAEFDFADNLGTTYRARVAMAPGNSVAVVEISRDFPGQPELEGDAS